MGVLDLIFKILIATTVSLTAIVNSYLPRKKALLISLGAFVIVLVSRVVAYGSYVEIITAIISIAGVAIAGIYAKKMGQITFSKIATIISSILISAGIVVTYLLVMLGMYYYHDYHVCYYLTEGIITSVIALPVAYLIYKQFSKTEEEKKVRVKKSSNKPNKVRLVSGIVSAVLGIIAQIVCNEVKSGLEYRVGSVMEEFSGSTSLEISTVKVVSYIAWAAIIVGVILIILYIVAMLNQNSKDNAIGNNSLQTPIAPTPQVIEDITSTTSFCANCGSGVDSGSNFCKGCGKSTN